MGHITVVMRKELIDPALAAAGWNVNDKVRVGIEIPVDGFPALNKE